MNDIERIWSAYQNNLYSFIKKRVFENDAEDILHDVYIKIHFRIRTLKDNTKLESWLYQITRNTVIDYYRSKKIIKEIPEWLEDPSVEESEQDSTEILSCLAPMINKLPDKYKRAIYHSEINGNTQKELAEIENISLSGAKSRVQRGRQMLKEMMLSCCTVVNIKNGYVSCEDRKKKCDTC